MSTLKGLGGYLRGTWECRIHAQGLQHGHEALKTYMPRKDTYMPRKRRVWAQGREALDVDLEVTSQEKAWRARE